MNTTYVRRWSLLLGIACAAAAGGCGSKQSASPAAPSATGSPVAAAPTATAGATITGTVIGVSSGSAIRTHSVNLTVSVTGTSTTSRVDDNGHFVLQNVPAGHVDLRFSGANVDAHLALDDVGEHESIAITVRVSGTTAQLDDDNREGPNNEAEVEGLVTAKGSSTLTVNGRLINVTTTTVIVHGDKTIAFSAIGIGDRVHVKGTSSGSTVAATKVEVQNQVTPPANDNHDGADDNEDDHGGNNGDDHGGNASAEASGAISGLGGTCPKLSFTIGSTSVKTDGSTQFKDAACSALKSGDLVEVKGTRQSDKSILATRVEKKK